MWSRTHTGYSLQISSWETREKILLPNRVTQTFDSPCQRWRLSKQSPSPCHSTPSHTASQERTWQLWPWPGCDRDAPSSRRQTRPLRGVGGEQHLLARALTALLVQGEQQKQTGHVKILWNKYCKHIIKRPMKNTICAKTKQNTHSLNPYYYYSWHSKSIVVANSI